MKNCIRNSWNSEIRSYIHNRFLITRNNSSNSQLSRNVFQLRRSQIGAGYGLVSHRNLSSASGGERVLNGVVGVVGDKAVEAAPVVNEVAVAAADSFSPVAALQYLVDYVHCYTGFNWWASIAVTTLLLRFIQRPFFIHKQKFISKYSENLVRPTLLANEFLKNKGDSRVLEEAESILFELMNKFGDIAALGLVISDVTMFIFFFAILNMAEKVPSFKTGGTLWFTDLTTPDSMRLPIWFALTLWIRIIHVEGGFKNAEKFYGALALLGTVTVRFPKAIYCYWITSNLFSIAFSMVIMDPLVRKLLGISTDKKTR